MTVSDYNFNVGDEVVTVYGEKGKIVYICKCNRCKERRFYEPIWKEDDSNEEHYISSYQAEAGFQNFYRIGKYRFNDFDKTSIQAKISDYEEIINRLRKQLSIIEELEKSEDDATCEKLKETQSDASTVAT